MASVCFFFFASGALTCGPGPSLPVVCAEALAAADPPTLEIAGSSM